MNLRSIYMQITEPSLEGGPGGDWGGFNFHQNYEDKKKVKKEK